MKFDTAAACSCFSPVFGMGCPEQPLAAELNHAGGGGIKTYGVSRSVQLHTGDVIIPSDGVVADVHDNLLAAHDYVGPGGDYAGWLCGNQSLFLNKEKDGELIARISAAVEQALRDGASTVPLVWVNRTLNLGPARGSPTDATRVGKPTKVAAVRKSAVPTVSARAVAPVAKVTQAAAAPVPVAENRAAAAPAPVAENREEPPEWKAAAARLAAAVKE